MASWLAAVGQANIPAVMKQYQDVSREMQEGPRREERYQWEKGRQAEFEQGAPARKAALEVDVAKAEEEKRVLEKKKIPMNIRAEGKKMGLTPEIIDTFISFGKMYGIDETGLGTTGDVENAFDKFTKSPLWSPAISGHVNYLNQIHENAERAYQDAIQKGKEIEKISELKTARDKTQQELTKWGGVKLESAKRLKDRELLLGSLNQLENEGTLKNLDPMIVSGLRSAADNGDRDSWDKLHLEIAKTRMKPAEGAYKIGARQTIQRGTQKVTQEVIGFDNAGRPTWEDVKGAVGPAFAPQKPEKPTDFDKKYEEARGIAREKLGRDPTKEERATFYRKYFGPSNTMEEIMEWAEKIKAARPVGAPPGNKEGRYEYGGKTWTWTQKGGWKSEGEVPSTESPKSKEFP